MSLLGPVFRGFRQAFPDGVLLDVFPFLRVVLGAAQAGVPIVALPVPALSQTGASEVGFPETNPRGERVLRVLRGAKQMNVVGHEQIIPNKPGTGFLPNVSE